MALSNTYTVVSMVSCLSSFKKYKMVRPLISLPSNILKILDLPQQTTEHLFKFLNRWVS